MRLLHLALTILMLGSGIGADQAREAAVQRTIAGAVVEAEASTPLAGATVSIGDIQATTDAEGQFSVHVPAGEIVVRAAAAGYFPLSTTPTRVLLTCWTRSSPGP